MDKPAPVAHPVAELIRDRWSPRAFGAGALAANDWRSLFEAARWAASCALSVKRSIPRIILTYSCVSLPLVQSQLYHADTPGKRGKRRSKG